MTREMPPSDEDVQELLKIAREEVKEEKAKDYLSEKPKTEAAQRVHNIHERKKEMKN